MNFKLTKPCSNCPFLREGGIRLHPQRAEEIADSQLSSQGASFACHKTVDYGDDPNEDGSRIGKDTEQYCAGALVFAEKNETANQILRIMIRIREYDPRKLGRASFDKVFGSAEEMIEASEQFDSPRKGKRRKA